MSIWDDDSDEWRELIGQSSPVTTTVCPACSGRGRYLPRLDAFPSEIICDFCHGNGLLRRIPKEPA